MGVTRQELPAELNAISKSIIGAAIEVHCALGPGLLERLYQEAFLHELLLRGFTVDKEFPIPVQYKGVVLMGQRIDLVVQQSVVVELKGVEKVMDVHLAQMLGYMKLGGFPLGLLINFHVPVLVKGVYRRVNSAALRSNPRWTSSAPSA